MKKSFMWAIALLLGEICLFTACNDDKNDNTPFVEPTVTLTAGEVTTSTLEFAVKLEDADKCAYLYTESSASVPTVEEILASGKSVSASGKVLIEDLNASTSYRISAVATRE